MVDETGLLGRRCRRPSLLEREAVILLQPHPPSLVMCEFGLCGEVLKGGMGSIDHEVGAIQVRSIVGHDVELGE